MRSRLYANWPTASAAGCVAGAPVRRLARRPAPSWPHPRVLLELVERSLDTSWHGPRVFASSDGAHEPQFTEEGWQVNLNDLNAIHQAVRHAQNGQAAPSQARCERRDLHPLHLHILVAEDNAINQLILR